MGEWRYCPTHSLTSALDVGEWSASRPGRFTPRERPPSTHWIANKVNEDKAGVTCSKHGKIMGRDEGQLLLPDCSLHVQFIGFDYKEQ